MKRKTYDAIGSLIFIAVAVAGLLECRNFSDSAALMPTFTLGAILFLSVIQLLMCSRVPDERAHINLKRMGIVLLALLLYVGLINVIGYYVCTLLFIAGLMFAFGIRKKKTLIAVPVIFCVFVFVVFAKGLSISLPSGVLF